MIGILLGLGIVMIVTMRGAAQLARGASTVPDPWGGHTLEWVAASPPSVDNFADQAVAPVRSAHPLWEAPAPSGGDAVRSAP